LAVAAANGEAYTFKLPLSANKSCVYSGVWRSLSPICSINIYVLIERLLIPLFSLVYNLYTVETPVLFTVAMEIYILDVFTAVG